MRTMLATVAIGCLGLSAAAAGAQPAGGGADQAARDEARAHFVQGLALMQNENWEAAQIEFSRSLDEFPTRSALFNLGMCQKALHRYADALRSFERWMAEFAGDAGAEERASVESAIAGLQGFFGTLTPVLGPAGAELVVDGRSLGTGPFDAGVPVEVGRHTVEVRLAGHRPEVRQIEVASREWLRVEVTLAPEEASPPIDPGPGPGPVGPGSQTPPPDEGLDPTAFWITAATAAAAGIVGGVAGGMVLMKADDFDAAVVAWRDDPTPEREAAARTVAGEHDDWRLATNVLLPAAGALAATALILALFTDFDGDPDEAPAATVTAAPLPAADGSGLAGLELGLRWAF